MSAYREPVFNVTVKGNTTTWKRVKPAVEPRRPEAEIEPDHFFQRRRLHTGKPPFDTPEAKGNHALRREYVLYWALRDLGIDMPFPEHLHGVTCGAKTRAGTPCKQRNGYANARCKFHGGLSTGPTSTEGKRRAFENGKLRGKTAASIVSANKAHEVLVNVDLPAPIDSHEPAGVLTAHDGKSHRSPERTQTLQQEARDTGEECEVHRDPAITPRAQEPSEYLNERDAKAMNLTKPNIAPAHPLADELEKASVSKQPTKKDNDLLARWEGI